MRSDIPYQQQQDAHSLSPDGIVELYQIDLISNPAKTIYLTGKQSRTWQGTIYEQIPCTMTEATLNSSGEVSRPKFSVANPSGMFSAFVAAGQLDNAIVTRFRLRRTDYENDVNAALINIWRVSRIMTVTKDLVACELRSVLDGQNFLLPGRQFFPPDFPHVSLY